MPKTTQPCAVCGESFTRYSTPKRPAIVCGRVCQYIRLEQNQKSPWLTVQNTQPGRNKRIAQENADKIRAGQPSLGQSNGRTYAKLHGRHAHRVAGERLIGRALRSDEIVHHKDRNKRNNHPDNLEVLTRSEHARLHAQDLTPEVRARKLCWEDVHQMRAMHASGCTQQYIATSFGVAHSMVHRIVRGLAWKA